MSVRRPLAALAVVLAIAAAGVSGCSPEATRIRNGGPGADVGNHSPNLPQPSTAPSPVGE